MHMPRNWNGCSVGAKLAFAVHGIPGCEVKVYTTRLETVCAIPCRGARMERRGVDM